MDTAADSPWRRLLANLALFYALTLAVGLLAGVIGALGAADFIEGTDVTAVYTGPGPDTVVAQGEDLAAGRLLLYPLLTLAGATLFVLPVVLLGLGLAELLGSRGVSVRSLKLLALIAAGIPALVVVTGGAAGIYVFAAFAVVAYAWLIRLPEPSRPGAV